MEHLCKAVYQLWYFLESSVLVALASSSGGLCYSIFCCNSCAVIRSARVSTRNHPFLPLCCSGDAVQEEIKACLSPQPYSPLFVPAANGADSSLINSKWESCDPNRCFCILGWWELPWPPQSALPWSKYHFVGDPEAESERDEQISVQTAIAGTWEALCRGSSNSRELHPEPRRLHQFRAFPVMVWASCPVHRNNFRSVRALYLCVACNAGTRMEDLLCRILSNQLLLKHS